MERGLRKKKKKRNLKDFQNVKQGISSEGKERNSRRSLLLILPSRIAKETYFSYQSISYVEAFGVRAQT